jgi:hypothetical protein
MAKQNDDDRTERKTRETDFVKKKWDDGLRESLQAEEERRRAAEEAARRAAEKRSREESGNG